MVATAKRTSPPLTGCVQVFSANKSRATLSSPGAGGALNSEPTTEKRKRAHRAAVDGSDFWVIMSPRKKGNRVKTTVKPWDTLGRWARRGVSSAGGLGSAGNRDCQAPGDRDG